MLVDLAVSLALYKPFGIAGLVIGTAVASFGMMVGQTWRLRTLLHGSLEGRETLIAVLKMLLASALLGLVAYGVWWGLDDALGRALPAQIVSVGTAILVGSLIYIAAVTAMKVEEAAQIRRLLAGRLRRAA